MLSTRTPLWMALVMTAGFVGCNPPVEPAAPPPSTSTTDPAPAAPAKDDMKGDTKDDMKAAPTPVPDAKVDTPAPTPTEPAPAPKPDDAPKVEAPKAAAAELSPKAIAGIKTLPEADQKLAMSQKVCAASGGPLGAMGTPYKVEFEGKPYFLCCDGCKDDFAKDAKSLVAKLGK